MSEAGEGGSRRPGGAIAAGPVLGVCGWSGAGKTTLLERVIPALAKQGLRLAVIKNDVHGLDIDRAGKDSDRLYRAGADVVVRGPGEVVIRVHRDDAEDFARAVRDLLQDHDLVLVEGHRSAPVDKVWLASDGDPLPPRGVERILAVMSRDEDRPRRLLELIDSWLPRAWASIPLRAGVLIGGSSTRMGRPKHLLPRGADTLLDSTIATLAGVAGEVVLLGGSVLPDSCQGVPRLCDPVDSPGGPLSGMIAAHRWCPNCAWLFCPCDLPNLSEKGIDWILGQRRPGRWAVLPRTAGGVEPLLALYEPQARRLLEDLAATGRRAPRLIAEHPKVATVEVPDGLADCWRGVNTPEDLRSEEARRRPD